jgi:DNA-binding IclR family transcriptional regulator
LKLLEPEAKQSEIIEAGRTGVAWNREETAHGIIAMAFWVEPASPVAPMVTVSWPRFRFTEAAAERAVEAARNLWEIHL